MPTLTFRSYAQNLEDILLWRALRHVPNGFYIDVGAHDPRVDSVSRGFYERGWRGVHFEPNPALAAAVRRDRPDERVFEVALADREGTVRFVMTRSSGLSTGSPAQAEAYRAAGEVTAERDMPMTTLAKVCGSLAGRDVHWMKIDVEGMEEAVLRGWDARALRPWIIVVEATLPGSSEPCHQGWEPLLLAADYAFVFFDGLNRFYVAKERADLQTAFTAPANVHDLAGGIEIDAAGPFAAWGAARQTSPGILSEAAPGRRWTWPLRRALQRLRRRDVGR
jgi:FkbM family methyltransferase